MESKFEVVYLSDSRYEEITIEVSYKGQILCQLNKDKGDNAVEIEFFAEGRVLQENSEMRFPFDEFLKVITEAKADLVSG